MATSTAVVLSACIARDTSSFSRLLEPGGALGLQPRRQGGRQAGSWGTGSGVEEGCGEGEGIQGRRHAARARHEIQGLRPSVPSLPHAGGFVGRHGVGRRQHLDHRHVIIPAPNQILGQQLDDPPILVVLAVPAGRRGTASSLPAGLLA